MRIALVTLILAPALAAEPPAEDRSAILAMAGSYDVNFRFDEYAPLAGGYELKEKFYEASASELIEVVEDSPGRIVLQHLLVVSDKESGEDHVIKHWAQIWTWEDPLVLDYRGTTEDPMWEKRELDPETVAGTWSQLVTQVDDTPRYEGFGRWTHELGESSWESSPTRRPLPRREYTKRDDYDYLLVTNRHTLTTDGWVHYQDNRKVVDREDVEPHALCMERGLNRYSKTDAERTLAASEWWKEHGEFWNGVRRFWSQAADSAPESFTYTTYRGGEGLSGTLERLQDESPTDESTIASALEPFVIAR